MAFQWTEWMNDCSTTELQITNNNNSEKREIPTNFHKWKALVWTTQALQWPMGTDLTSDPKKLVKQETKNNNACLMLVDTKIRVPLKY